MSDPPGLLRRLDRTGVPLLLARLVLGGMFIRMGAEKIQDPVGFLKLIRQYEMVPESLPLLLNLIAVVLPWLEVFCGLLLIAGTALRGTGVLMLVMLVVFTGAVALRAVGIFQQGGTAFCAIKFDCGCGGGPTFICRKLIENSGLMFLAVVVLASNARRFCLRGNLIGRSSSARV